MVLLYLLVPVLVVGLAASVVWLRNREPTSLESGVEMFRREMQALSPEASPEHRRRTDPAAPDGHDAPAGAPRHHRVMPERPAPRSARPDPEVDRPQIKPSAPPPRRPSTES